MNHELSKIADWRHTALQLLPELAEEIREAETPYLLWIDLRLVFEAAYRSLPLEDSLIQRIYQFGRWCFSQPRGKSAEDDLLTCVFVCFFEHIPDCKAALDDVTRWLSSDDFAVLEGVFKETMTKKSFLSLSTHFHKCL